MKRSELFFSIFLIPVDYFMLILAGISAYFLRYTEWVRDIRPIIFDLEFNKYLEIIFIIAFFWIIIFAFFGLYNIKRKFFTKEVYRIFLGSFSSFSFVVFLIFLSRELFESRFIVLFSTLFAFLYVSLARFFVRFLEKKLFKYGIGVHKIIVIGNSKITDDLIREFSSQKKFGFEIVKRVRDFGIKTRDDIKEFIKDNKVDEIILLDTNLSRSEILRIYDFTDEYHIVFKYVSDLLGTKVLKTEVQEILGVPIVEVKKTRLEGWSRIIKRFFDIVLSFILIILFSPLMFFIAIIIKIDSRGPIFYLDYRSGQYNKKFLFYKFRSMVTHLCDGAGPSATKEGNKVLQELIKKNLDTRVNQPLHKIKDDPRVTRVGKILRRWSIDELPQLFNVLRGDISLVGPRPHMTMETAKYETYHKKVFTVKPGITGMAQVAGRSDLNFEEEVKLDIYYIENWSFLLDLSILFKTPLAIIRKRKVA